MNSSLFPIKITWTCSDCIRYKYLFWKVEVLKKFWIWLEESIFVQKRSIRQNSNKFHLGKRTNEISVWAKVTDQWFKGILPSRSVLQQVNQRALQWRALSSLPPPPSSGEQPKKSGVSPWRLSNRRQQTVCVQSDPPLSSLSSPSPGGLWRWRSRSAVRCWEWWNTSRKRRKNVSLCLFVS